MNVSGVAWRKSSRSSGSGDCVEVAILPDRVLIRDSKDPGGPVLAVPPKEWRGFLASLSR
ncbi:MAG: DUF397 domain-containing protein [Micromonosporaceae bacterium]|nr:DUF397 domain-containing protein [Micromonosporaceae bacterium]